MELADELKYLSQMLDKKLISKESVGKRLGGLARREKDRPIVELNDLFSRAMSGYAFSGVRFIQPRPGCDCQVNGCTYPDFRARHAAAVAFAHLRTGYTEPELPASHLAYMKENKAKLDKRKDEAKNRADQDYAKAMASIKARHQKALQEAEEMK